MTTMRLDGTPDKISDALLETAAVWHARLREPDANPQAAAARRAEFDRWVAADRRHVRAFEEAERLWVALGVPAEKAMTQDLVQIHAGPRRLRLFRASVIHPAMLAACLAVFVVAGVLYRDDFLVGLRSDHVTAIGQRTPTTLDDGSRVTLNTDSAIAVDLATGQRRVRLLRGEAWFDVNPGGANPFLVETAAGSIRVTGTSFGVRLQGSTTIVSLTEGQVELMAINDRDETPGLTLRPGQQARLSPVGISDPVAFDETAVTGWLRGQFVFFNTPLPDVVAELNRYRTGHIVVANDELDDLRINGVFKTDDPDAALTLIADTLPVRVTRLTNLLVLLR